MQTLNFKERVQILATYKSSGARPDGAGEKERPSWPCTDRCGEIICFSPRNTGRTIGPAPFKTMKITDDKHLLFLHVVDAMIINAPVKKEADAFRRVRMEFETLFKKELAAARGEGAQAQ